MASLTYSMTASLDGYIADENGKFDWAEPDEEVHTFVAPVLVGAGKQALPRDGRIELELVDERRFRNGTVFLHYRPRTS